MSSTVSRRAAIALMGGTLAAWPAWLDAADGIANGPTHDGSEVDCDLPSVIRIRNTVGTDGAGLCVWASTEMMARYLNAEGLIGVFQQMQGERGGGWPDRVDAVMRQRAPVIKYRQYYGPDLAFIQEGIDSGRPVCVTYGYGELYGMRTIAHMVLCVGMNSRYTAILDNNDPSNIWWMSTPEFGRRFVHPGASGWAWVVLAPPPPPIPRNKEIRYEQLRQISCRIDCRPRSGVAIRHLHG